MAVFLSPKTQTAKRWTLAQVEFTDAYTDFILSRQAKLCTPATMSFYKYTAGMFLSWVQDRAVSPAEITARHVREYLAYLAGKGNSGTTVHDHARAIRTLLKFWYAEKYIPAPIVFDMPKPEKKRLPVLSAEELKRVLSFCDVREKAIILFMADSGLRRAEVCSLNWGDVDMQSGLVRVKQGKGRKDRSAVIGATARRALLAYRRQIENHNDKDPLIQGKGGKRFTGSGLRAAFRRLSMASGILVTAHAMRRTFVILSLRAKMNPLVLQNLLGHADLQMVNHYAQMVDEDLLQEHKAHSPVDNL